MLESLWEIFSEELFSSISDPSAVESNLLIEIFSFLLKDAMIANLDFTEKLADLIDALLAKILGLIGRSCTSMY